MITNGFLLLAVFSVQDGKFDFKAGYQSSAMQRFDSLEQCTLAGKAFQKVQQEGSFKKPADQVGSMKCLDLESGEITNLLENSK